MRIRSLHFSRRYHVCRKKKTKAGGRIRSSIVRREVLIGVEDLPLLHWNPPVLSLGRFHAAFPPTVCNFEGVLPGISLFFK